MDTILVIDDEEDNLYIASEAIKHACLECEVLTASTLDQLIVILNAKERREFICAVIDITMPGVNGWDFMRMFKALDRNKDVPVIMSSSNAKPVVPSDISYYPNVFFWEKPFQFKDLVEEFKKIGNRSPITFRRLS